MPYSFRPLTFLRLTALLILLLGAACAGGNPAGGNPTSSPSVEALLPTAADTAAPEPTQPPIPTDTASPTEAPTATAPPTEAPTAAATATAVQTQSPTESPAASAPGGLAMWCLPEGAALPAAYSPLDPPANARLSAQNDDSLVMRNLPNEVCVVTYTAQGATADALKLHVYELGNATPWLTTDLQPVEGSPEVYAAVLRHTYIVAPPLWQISYEFAVADGAGAEQMRQRADLFRWEPTLCWNGRRPDPITLRCPLQQDLHPWDAGYGTPMPTAPPED